MPAPMTPDRPPRTSDPDGRGSAPGQPAPPGALGRRATGGRSRLAPAAVFRLACLVLLAAGLAGCSMLKAGEPTPGPEAGHGSELERAGDLHAANGQPDLAVIEYDWAMAAGGPKARLARKKAEARLAGGSAAEALDGFKAALAAAPSNGSQKEVAEATLGAGRAALILGRTDEAARFLEWAAAADPGRADAVGYLGVARDRQGLPAAAVEEHRRALALIESGSSSGMSEASVRNNLGVSLLALSQPAQAEEEFRRSLALRPDPRVRNNLGLALGRQARYEEAMAEFIPAGGEAVAWNNLGMLLMEAGQPDRAEECFERAIVLSPEYYPKAMDNLDRARRLNRPEPAGSLSQPPARAETAVVEPDAPAPAVDKKPRGAASESRGLPARGFALLESSWRSEDKAGQRAAELRARGQAAFAAAADLGDKGMWHRVLVGPFPTAAEAKAYREGRDPARGMAAAKILPLPAGEAPAGN